MTINVTIGVPDLIGSGAAAVLSSNPIASETVSTAGTASTISAQPGQVWLVTPEVDCFVTFGTAPDGATGPRWRCKAGVSLPPLEARVAGEKIAFATS